MNVQLNSLVSSGIVEAYPPLCDKKGSYTAQFEHVSNGSSRFVWGSPANVWPVPRRLLSSGLP